MLTLGKKINLKQSLPGLVRSALDADGCIFGSFAIREALKVIHGKDVVDSWDQDMDIYLEDTEENRNLLGTGHRLVNNYEGSKLLNMTFGDLKVQFALSKQDFKDKIKEFDLILTQVLINKDGEILVTAEALKELENLTVTINPKGKHMDNIPCRVAKYTERFIRIQQRLEILPHQSKK